MAEITSLMKDIKGILDNKNQFVIPDFQRSFVWTDKEVDTLFLILRKIQIITRIGWIRYLGIY